MTAAFDLAISSSAPSSSGRPLSSEGKIASGWAHSGGPHGLLEPGAGVVGLGGLARRGTEVAQQHHGRDAEHADRGQERVADEGTTGDAGVLGAGGQRLEGGLAVLVGGARGVAHLDHLDIAHELAGPLDGRGADQQQRETEEDAQADGGGTEAEEGRPVVTDVSDEVGDAEEHHADHREQVHRGDLALGAPGGVLVDVRGTPRVAGQTRVGDRLLRRQVVCARPGAGQLVAHACTFFLLERVVCAAIQTAKPTRPPMPTIQANRPSATGPRLPMPKPPTPAESLRLLR